MKDQAKYVMDVCELCQKPIGFDSHVTDGNGEHPLHTACLDEADLKARGFIPAGGIRQEQFGKMTADLIPPNKDDGKGHA